MRLMNIINVHTLFFCLILSCFFSIAETTVTSLTEIKTKQIINSQKRGVNSLKIWSKFPNRILTTILLANNISNILSTSIATILSQELFQSWALGISTGGMTVLILIFGEIIPKTFAKYRYMELAPIIMTLLVPIYWLLYPLILCLTSISDQLLKIILGKYLYKVPVTTEEDVSFIIKMGHQEGFISKDEKKMLKSVIDFKKILVREVMVPRTEINSFSYNCSLKDIIEKINKYGHSRWPVYNKKIDDILGIFHTKDLGKILSKRKKNINLRKYIKRALFVPDMINVGLLLKDFQCGETHMAIVVDEYGGTAGIISLEDILEELVGDIRDEYDNIEDERIVEKISNNQYYVDGKANIDYLRNTININFPENALYDTIGGFVISESGKIPEEGSKLYFKGWKFEVKDSDKTKVNYILIEKVNNKKSSYISNR